MKKRLAGIALATVMALSLAGCGGSNGGATTAADTLSLIHILKTQKRVKNPSGKTGELDYLSFPYYNRDKGRFPKREPAAKMCIRDRPYTRRILLCTL